MCVWSNKIKLGLNHFDNKGNAVMVDVSDKDITERIATAEGKIKMNRTAIGSCCQWNI